jgi:hypothetical protein
LLAVLFALIPVLWLVLVLIGLTIFRTAARSDAAQAPALADWLRITEQDATDALELQPQTLESDQPYGSYRAAG